jgi:hypothetical protein
VACGTGEVPFQVVAHDPRRRHWHRSRDRAGGPPRAPAVDAAGSNNRRVLGFGRPGGAAGGTVARWRCSVLQRCNRFAAASVVAHELGHVLGLKHTTATCATMNPEGSEWGGAQCPRLKPWQWRCRLLEFADIAAAADLYGGKPAALPGAAHCNLYRAQDAPARLDPARAGGFELRVSGDRVSPAGGPVAAVVHPYARAAGVLDVVRRARLSSDPREWTPLPSRMGI